jgi:hypothetical protein
MFEELGDEGGIEFIKRQDGGGFLKSLRSKL